MRSIAMRGGPRCREGHATRRERERRGTCYDVGEHASGDERGGCGEGRGNARMRRAGARGELEVAGGGARRAGSAGGAGTCCDPREGASGDDEQHEGRRRARLGNSRRRAAGGWTSQRHLENVVIRCSYNLQP